MAALEFAATDMRSPCHIFKVRKTVLITVQVIFWVLGEYGAQADIGAAGVMEKVAAVGERRSLSDTVRGYMLTAVAKLVAQARLFVRGCICSSDVNDKQQRNEGKHSIFVDAVISPWQEFSIIPYST